MTTGEEESSAGGSSKGRGSGEALLVEVELLVPLAPDLGGGKHASGTALVTKGSLTGTVSSSSRDTGNTGNGTSSSP